MLRIWPFHLVVSGLLLVAVPSPAALPQDNVARSAAIGCDLRRIRAIASDQMVANFVGCQYETITSFLPPFATINWVVLDAPVGRVLRQSASQGTPYSRLGDRFTLTVSAGPGVSIATPTAVDGGTLTFQLQPPVLSSGPYGAEYWIALDQSGRTRAREGTHYVSAIDNSFLQGGTLDVRTRLGSGVDRLYVIVVRTFAPDGPAASTLLGSGAGRIVQYPRVSLSASAAREGSALTFVARIDRSGLPRETFAYRFGLEGDAERGVDYVSPPTTLLRFAPGEEVARLSIRTLDNSTSFEDRSLALSIAVPGQRPVVARGTILNTTVRPPDEVDEEATEVDEEAPEEGEAEDAAPDPEESAAPESDNQAPVSEDDGASDETGADQGEEGLWPLLTNWGLGWLAAIGAIAIGLLAGFLFGAKSQKPAAVEENGDEREAPEPDPLVAAPVPMVGWTTATPKSPTVRGGSVSIDGPSITIDVEPGEGKPGRLESMSILSEGPLDE